MEGEPARHTPTGRPLRLVGGVAPDPGDEEAMVLELPPQRRSVAVGRHWVVRVAAAAGVTGMANQVVELLASELLSNAVLHGTRPAPDRPILIEFGLGDGVVRVQVTDNVVAPPMVLHPEPIAPAGRGMAIVDAMAHRWGVEEAEVGKTVWFEIDLDEY